MSVLPLPSGHISTLVSPLNSIVCRLLWRVSQEHTSTQKHGGWISAVIQPPEVAWSKIKQESHHRPAIVLTLDGRVKVSVVRQGSADTSAPLGSPADICPLGSSGKESKHWKSTEGRRGNGGYSLVRTNKNISYKALYQWASTTTKRQTSQTSECGKQVMHHSGASTSRAAHAITAPWFTVGITFRFIYTGL